MDVMFYLMWAFFMLLLVGFVMVLVEGVLHAYWRATTWFMASGGVGVAVCASIIVGLDMGWWG